MFTDGGVHIVVLIPPCETGVLDEKMLAVYPENTEKGLYGGGEKLDEW